ncbi:hypothetical protein BL241_03400 [Ralstonia solanacearum]|uniref:Uncharacterized protein n=1 Tax=Ralstonia solanacearum TaxID=305 RepID=A0A0S4UBM7_RALSL|nr:hypothetical protein BL241_03400 [Ralstonia solanacearum]CUV19589.1 conserved protein of unknown function [Ralstonia solanacearum]
MDKFSIKVTLTSVTAPTLFHYLASIVDSKQRAHALRHMAELGYTAFLARQAAHSNGVPTQAVALTPAVPAPVPAALAAFASENFAASPSPAPATHSDAVTTAALDSSTPDGLPTAMAEHLGEAMARFFPT